MKESEEIRNSDLAARLKEELNVDTNAKVLELLSPHLPGIRKPSPSEGYPEPKVSEVVREESTDPER
jgi:hypothetical protein